MTLSHKDAINNCDKFIKENKIISSIFSNVLLVSILLSILLLFVFEMNIDNRISQLFYSTLLTTIILLLNSKMIKNKYTEKTGSQDKLFTGMMENNSSPEKVKIISTSEPRPRDIEAFLAT
jgi:hypothetical protein